MTMQEARNSFAEFLENLATDPKTSDKATKIFADGAEKIRKGVSVRPLYRMVHVQFCEWSKNLRLSSDEEDRFSRLFFDWGF